MASGAKRLHCEVGVVTDERKCESSITTQRRTECSMILGVACAEVVGVVVVGVVNCASLSLRKVSIQERRSLVWWVCWAKADSCSSALKD